MTVRLRAHHLLCMLTYVGRGYSPAFTAGYERVVRRIASGEPLMVVDGPDDICAPLLNEEEEPHCLKDGAATRDRHAATSLARLLDRPVVAGTTLAANAALLARLRKAFSSGRLRRACIGCQWSRLCSSVAEQDYAGAHLAPPRDFPRTSSKEYQ